MSKAEDLLSKGLKKLRGWKLFGNKYEEAVELLEKAGNMFKNSKDYQQAAEAYIHASTCRLKLEDQYEAAKNLVDAATCLKKLDPEEAVSYMQQAVDLYIESGRFGVAAKCQKEIAEIYEGASNLDAAMNFYQQAADSFHNAEQMSQANQCVLKMGELAAEAEKFGVAAGYFEEVARASLENSLLRYSVKDYLFKAGLCRLAESAKGDEDLEVCRKHIEGYNTLDISFPDTRESELLMGVLTAFEKYDVDKFEDSVREYDMISKLDDWKVRLLMQVKDAIKLGPTMT